MTRTMPNAFIDAACVDTSAAPIDVGELRARLHDDTQLLSELASIFRDDAPKQIERIKTAISNGDARGLEMAAHALKGAASVLFAKPLTEAARQLESLGRDKQLTAAPKNLETLQQEWSRLKPEMDQLCDEVQKP